MKDKKNTIIIVMLVVLIAIVIFIYFSDTKGEITFSLIGTDNMVVDYGSKFTDPGFIAMDGHGNDITSNVVVNGTIDTLKSGAYKITYELNLDEETRYLTRVVMVKDISINDLQLMLNGDESIYIIKGGKYEDEGAYVLNTINNTNFEEGDISIANNIDTSKIGNYEINYTFTYKGSTTNIVRNVNVFDINYSISPETITTNKVKIRIDLDNVKNYSNTKLPDGTTSLSKNIEYEVKSNGDYKFVIYMQNKDEYERIVTVKNIIANYVCNGEINSTGTKINITPVTNEVKKYEWIVKGQTNAGSNSYSVDKIVNNATVNLYFENNEKYTVNCNIQDKLVYHFKYDAANTKPFMKCNTYTLQDKARLDAQLKQVIAEAGVGTRAGVVAAARFLVGGLDYKLPYEGGIYYRKVGLNIGQANAWGCSRSGLDCYSFVAWARAQNGLPDDGFYNGTKYSVASEINNIRVGDYILTPCSSSSCKNSNKINHIGLVIGVDSNSIYVAENKTAGVDALVVTRLDKSNPPRSGNLSLVRHINYPGEGNVTNMWLSE